MTTIAFDRVSKRYGPVTALDELSVDVAPGRITAFLGANGSGKTTSMRVLLGLSLPDAGSATIEGRAYRDLPHPLRRVGAVLDQGFHPARTARNHLRIVAAQAGVARSAVERALARVELTEVADRRVGGYSLGMRQRLSLAAATIADPAVLVLDEPFNGLDPSGIGAMRAFLRNFADTGGTVFLSSHLLAEVAHSADDAVIIDRGRLVRAGPVAELAAVTPGVVVTTPDVDLLAALLVRHGGRVERTGREELTVVGPDAAEVGRTAAESRIVITGMRPVGDDLESVFASLVQPSTVAPVESSSQGAMPS